MEIKVPDIGDFKDVEVIEVLVATGQKIKKNDPLITIESDKSSVEIPSIFDGKIKSVKTKIGDKVSEGDLILILENVTREKEEIDENLKIENETKKDDLIDLDFSKIGNNKFFYDLIYNPNETNFLKTGKELGNRIENGKMMFIYQAHQAFTVWHKIMPEINDEVINIITND